MADNDIIQEKDLKTYNDEVLNNVKAYVDQRLGESGSEGTGGTSGGTGLTDIRQQLQ